MRRSLLTFMIIGTMILSFCCSQSKVYAADTTISSEVIANYFNSKVGSTVPEASCLAFIANGFANMGAERSSACCAYNYGSSHIMSTSKDNIPVGADVFLNWNSKYSYTKYVCPTCGKYCHHVGVYVGDGYIVHTSGGKVIKTSLSELLNYWNLDFRGWGYHGNVNIGNGGSGTVDGSRVHLSGVTSLTDTTARINATLSPVGDITEAGFYLGTDPNYMSKTVEVASQKQCNSVWYDLGTGKWTGALARGTTYYYQIYVVIGGTAYKSTVDSFTTTGDLEPPVLSNVSIVDVNDLGYTVVCDATDNTGIARVCFPTWTEYNGQDDIEGDDITVQYTPYYGNSYAFRVNVSSHNYEVGKYITHVYAYDYSGNYVCQEITHMFSIPVQKITLNSTVCALKTGGSTMLTATVTPSNATDKTITWTSSNTGVATVNNGIVKAVGNGTAVVTAKTRNGIAATCTITVATSEPSAVSVSDTTVTLLKGQTRKLQANVSPVNAYNKTITWLSSNSKIVNVDSNGTISAVGGGIATITARTANGKMGTCTVTVADVKLTATSIVMQKNRTTDALRIKSKYPVKDSVKSWQSSNDEVVMLLDNKGKLEANGVGMAVITVTMKSGATANCVVTVQRGKVTTKSITFENKKVTLAKKQSKTLKLRRNPITATEKVKWKSSNKKVATVNSKGKVTAKKTGKTTITAKTTNGKKAICKVTVKNPKVILKSTKGTVKVKKTLQIKLKSTFPDKDKVKAYKSSNKKIATVSQTGKVKGIKKGTATITVTMKSGAKAKFKVTVKK